MARPIELVTPEMERARDEFTEIICSELGVPQEYVKARNGKAPVAFARQFIMWALYQFTGCTTTQIGILMNRNRATVIYSIDIIAGRVSMDKKGELSSIVDKIKLKSEELKDVSKD